MDQIRGIVAGLDGAARLDVLVGEFVRISGLKRAAGGNYTYNGALHGLYAAVQNILNTPISGSTGFVGFGKITEPQNAKYWNDVNSYESWLYAELTAFAAGRPAAKPTAPLGKPEDQFDHEAFMGLLVEAKDQAKARLSGVAIKTAPVRGPLGLAPVASGVGLPVAGSAIPEESAANAQLVALQGELAVRILMKDEIDTVSEAINRLTPSSTKEVLVNAIRKVRTDNDVKIRGAAAAKPLSAAIAVSVRDDVEKQALLAKLNTELAANRYDESTLLKKWTGLPVGNKTALVANLLNSTSSAKDFFELLATAPTPAAPKVAAAKPAAKPTAAAAAVAAAARMRAAEELSNLMVETAEEAQKPALRAKLNAELVAKPYNIPLLKDIWARITDEREKKQNITALSNPGTTAEGLLNALKTGANVPTILKGGARTRRKRNAKRLQSRRK